MSVYVRFATKSPKTFEKCMLLLTFVCQNNKNQWKK